MGGRLKCPSSEVVESLPRYSLIACALCVVKLTYFCWRYFPLTFPLAPPSSPPSFSSLSPASDHVRSLRREPIETPTALFRAIHTPEKDLCRGRAIILECSLGIATSTICVPLSPLVSSLLSSCSPSFAPSSDPPILPSPFHPSIHTCTTPVHAFTQTTTTTPISPSRRLVVVTSAAARRATRRAFRRAGWRQESPWRPSYRTAVILQQGRNPLGLTRGSRAPPPMPASRSGRPPPPCRSRGHTLRDG